MKILKKGKLKTRRFLCEYCGCNFIANETEYKSRTDSELMPKLIDHFQGPTGVYKISDIYKCDCPYCHKKVENLDYYYYAPELKKKVDYEQLIKGSN